MNIASSSHILPTPTAPRNSPFWNVLTADIHADQDPDRVVYFDSTSGATTRLDTLPVEWEAIPVVEEEKTQDSDSPRNLPGLWPQGLRPQMLSQPIYRSTSKKWSDGEPIKDAKRIASVYCMSLTLNLLYTQC
jgi:hypothetical protein